MPIYKCPLCERTVTLTKRGRYHCKYCGPTAIMLEVYSHGKLSEVGQITPSRAMSPKEKKITGEAYEFIKKYRFVPGAPVEPITVYAKPIGPRTVDVKYIIDAPPLPAEVPPNLRDWVDRMVFHAIANKEYWKYPAEGAYRTSNLSVALYLADVLRRFTGGSWIIKTEEYDPITGKRVLMYYVWTKGYYHYIGASSPSKQG